MLSVPNIQNNSNKKAATRQTHQSQLKGAAGRMGGMGMETGKFQPHLKKKVTKKQNLTLPLPNGPKYRPTRSARGAVGQDEKYPITLVLKHSQLSGRAVA